MKLTNPIMAAFASCLLLVSLPAAAQTPHPLVGKIFDTQTGFVTDLGDAAMIPKLFPCGTITLLGEVHDNADHHRMRGELVAKQATSDQEQHLDWRLGCADDGAVVLEHVDTSFQDVLDNYTLCTPQHHNCGTAKDLLTALHWTKSGWGSEKIFAPMFDQILRTNRVLIAAGLTTDIVRNVARTGLAAVPPAHVLEFKLEHPLHPSLIDALLTELEEGHCGLMPKSAFGNMGIAQRYRDAFMADVAMKSAKAYGRAIIFAGNGHIRTDRGIPYYLKQRAPDRKVIAVAFVETEDGKSDPAAYSPRDPAGQPAADYVAFAAPAQRDDPCESMRAQFKAKPLP